MQNKKQQKNRLFKAGIITVFVALLSLTLVSGTYASYTSEATVQDEAQIATWKWVSKDVTIVDGAEQVQEATAVDIVNGSATALPTFKLLSGTIYDLTDDGQGNVDLENTEEEDIKDGHIAPGCGGYKIIKIENASEVNAKFSATFAATGNIPAGQIEYSTDNENWDADIAKCNVPETLLAMETGTAEVKIFWRWTFDNTEVDNAYGDGAHNITIAATLTMTQVD